MSSKIINAKLDIKNFFLASLISKYFKIYTTLSIKIEVKIIKRYNIE